MLEAIMNNLINIGWAMLIFLAAYLSNVAFSPVSYTHLTLPTN